MDQTIEGLNASLKAYEDKLENLQADSQTKNS